MRILIFVIAFVLCSSSYALAASLKYKCTFPSYANPDGINDTNDFNLEFVVDTITKEAVMIGNNGFSPVRFLFGNSGVTFSEELPTGAIQTTTIATQGDAVHSRHTLILGDLVPSQYYGTCTSG